MSFKVEELQEFLQTSHSHFLLEDIEAASLLASGRPGKALEFLENSDVLQEHKTMYHHVRNILKQKDISAEFAFIAEIVKEEKLVKDFLEIFLAVLRYELIEEVEKDSNPADVEKKIQLIKKTEETQEMLKRNVNSRLALENLILLL